MCLDLRGIADTPEFSLRARRIGPCVELKSKRDGSATGSSGPRSGNRDQLPLKEMRASLEGKKPPDSIALLLPRFGRIDISQNPVQRLTVEIGQHAKGVRPLTHPLPDSGWHLVGQ